MRVHAAIDGPEQRFTQDRSFYRGGPNIRNKKSSLAGETLCGKRSERKIQDRNALQAEQAVVNLGRAPDIDNHFVGIELPTRMRQLASCYRPVIDRVMIGRRFLDDFPGEKKWIC